MVIVTGSGGRATLDRFQHVTAARSDQVNFGKPVNMSAMLPDLPVATTSWVGPWMTPEQARMDPLASELYSMSAGFPTTDDQFVVRLPQSCDDGDTQMTFELLPGQGGVIGMFNQNQKMKVAFKGLKSVGEGDSKRAVTVIEAKALHV